MVLLLPMGVPGHSRASGAGGGGNVQASTATSSLVSPKPSAHLSACPPRPPARALPSRDVVVTRSCKRRATLDPGGRGRPRRAGARRVSEGCCDHGQDGAPARGTHPGGGRRTPHRGARPLQPDPGGVPRVGRLRGWARGVPPAPPRDGRPDPRAHGQGQRARPHPGARPGGRRLRDQALQPPGARGPRPGHPAPGRAGPRSGGRSPELGGIGPRPAHPRGPAPRPARGADRQGVRAAPGPHEPPEPGVHAGLPPGTHLGVRVRGRHAHSGHAHQPPPREDRGRPGRPDLHRDDPGRGVQVQEGGGLARPMRRSLRWKLTASYLLLVVFSLAVAAAYLIPAITRLYLTAYERDMLTQAALAARMLGQYRDEGVSLARLDQIANAFSWRRGVYVGVKDARGRPPSTSRWEESGPVPPEVRAALTGSPHAVDVRYDPGSREDRVFVAAPVVARGAVEGVVQISVPRVWVDRALRPVWEALATALLLGAAAAWALGAWRAKAVAAPVLELARAARRISAGDLGGRVEVRTADEIGQLAGSFNRMAAELREQLRALGDERTKVEAIISSMTDAVVAVDDRGAILLLNRAAEELLGVPRAARGRPVDEALGSHPLVRVLHATARENRETVEELPSGPGGERILDVHAAPLRNPAGKVTGAVAVVRDVTELRQAERMRRELTANVSHELRTPLTSIKGFAETLLAGAMADETTCRRFLEIIDSEASRLMKLVDDLMALSRLESRAVTMDFAPVQLDTLVAEAASRMRPQAEQARIALRTTGSAPDPVLADRDRILQVLTNLLDNAIKFTPEGGTVEVAVRQEGGETVVTVTDSGRGIPEDALPRIFDRFYRVERSRSREGGGTGLGLAIAKHIVEAHGGRITVASRLGVGTSFTVTLPRAPLGGERAPG